MKPMLHFCLNQTSGLVKCNLLSFSVLRISSRNFSFLLSSLAAKICDYRSVFLAANSSNFEQVSVLGQPKAMLK